MTQNLGSSRRAPLQLFPFALYSVGAAALALVLLNAGCASPGEPSARSQPVPEAISDLAASQSGNSVLLTFMVPQDSQAGNPLEHPPTLEIYRDFESLPAPGELHPTAPKHPTLLTTIPSGLVPQYTQRAQFRYLDHLNESEFSTHPNSDVVYSVRARVSIKTLSAPSNLAELRVYPAPQPISDLQGKGTPTAVVLSWSAPQRTPVGPVPPIAAYRIYRGELQVPSGSPAESQNEQAYSAPSSLPGALPSAPALQTPLAIIGQSSSPSFIDTHADFGKSYLYSVRSVVNYSGVAIESADSNFLTITRRDIFAPSPPTGLVGVLVPASSAVVAHVDLSWAVSSETDLAGYTVYRSEQVGVLGAPLNSKLLLTPAFRDMNVASGHRYVYSVTAVDRSGNESQPGTAVSVTVPDSSAQRHD